ncbi:MAG: MarR family transcriptional regulator, partial [Anaerolineae bacterium]|nr:MarR family transcriptional regulator [Anaerolineae bacterium]
MAGKKLNKLSERQRNILRFVQRYTSQKDYPPTIREIGEATGINSTSVVNYNLNKLVEAGLVERSDRVSRGLRLTGEAAGVRKRVSAGAAGPRVPLIGMIVASEPAAIPDDSGHYYDDDDLIEVPSSLLAGNDPEQVYALKVRGDSMMDAMIQEGDIVILRRQNTASQG